MTGDTGEIIVTATTKVTIAVNQSNRIEAGGSG
jgi:hypothetical protein